MFKKDRATCSRTGFLLYRTDSPLTLEGLLRKIVAGLLRYPVAVTPMVYVILR